MSMESSEGAPDLVAHRIDDWRRRLVDLSHRNRLINYKPTKSTTLEVREPGMRVVLEDLIAGGSFSFYEPPEEENEQDEHGQPPAADQIVTQIESKARLDRILEQLARRSNAEYQDKDLRILHIVGGFLDWVDPVRRQEVSSPLVLVPVELKRESARHPYLLSAAVDEEIVINPALSIQLNELGVELPEDWAWENKPLEEELEEILSALATTDWRVREEAVIGLFSFQKLVMFRDLLDNQEQIEKHAMVGSLALRRADTETHDALAAAPGVEDLDAEQDPHTSFSVLDADSYQRRCIEAAKRGCSFVMQGPPGTGKSQTISNIIAEAVGSGKQVLFVSEKIAALEVVHKRLEAAGLGDFCLNLHGRSATRKAVVDALYESLTSRLSAPMQMDATSLDRLRDLRDELNESVRHLHEVSDALDRRSAFDVYGEIARRASVPQVSGAPSESCATHDQLRAEFTAIADSWHLVVDSDYVWAEFDGIEFGAADRSQLTVDLDALDRALRTLRAEGAEAATELGKSVPGSPDAARASILLAKHFENTPLVESSWLDLDHLERVDGVLGDAEAAYVTSEDREQEFRERFPHRNHAEISPEVVSGLRGELQALEATIGRTAAWENGLLGYTAEGAAFLLRSGEQHHILIEAGARLAELLGQPSGSATPREIETLCDLSDLAYGAVERPDPAWLVSAGLQQARLALEHTSPLLLEFQAKRWELLQSYSESALEIPNVEQMAGRFTAAEGKRLAKLGSAYRTDVKVLKSCRRDGATPTEPGADTAAILLVLRLRDQVRTQARQLEPLGGWNQLEETAVAGVGQALETAQAAIESMAPDSDIPTLATKLCRGSQPDPGLAQQVTVARAALKELREGWANVEEVSTRYTAAAFDVRPVAESQDLAKQLYPLMSGLAVNLANLQEGRSRADASLSQIEEDAEILRDLFTAEATIDASGDEWAEVIGSQFRGPATEWVAIQQATDWVRTLLNLAAADMTPEIRHQVESRASLPDRTSAYDQYESDARKLARRFDDTRCQELLDTLRTGSWNEVESLIRRLRESMDTLHAWTDFRASALRVEEVGWGEVLRSMREARVDREEVVDTFSMAYWSAKLEARFKEQPSLKRFRGLAHQRLVEEFQGLDRALMSSAAARVVAGLQEKRPDPVATRGSEVSLLLHEAKKKKRHLPVRTLVQQLSIILPRLKPCLMMSPLSVSHFLGPDHHFDLVVFDEASQVPPWDAINCIYRGDQLVIAGDSKQLPPTSFFQIAGDEEEAEDLLEEDATELTESILDLCETVLPTESLRWHYRSRHEDLIAFSNHQFYGNKLITFPAPEIESASLGVEFMHVPDGIYDRGGSRTNRVEARFVAERVVFHLEQEQERSLGVVALSNAQADAIIDELDRMKFEHPVIEERFAEGRLEGLFVKNLESVQGDERDVMIFSLGYGKDQHGKFPMQFGPLTGDGGPRRLNVAVSRAREKMEVVASVMPAEFDLRGTSSPGPRLIKKYLDFAANGAEALHAEVDSSGGDYDSPFEEAVANAVRALGYEIVPQVGVAGYRIDLGLVDPAAPGRFLLGIECDGATYHSSPTARDRDRLRQHVLEAQGWTIHRVWSWDWVRSESAELDRLEKVIAELRAVEASDDTHVEGTALSPDDEPNLLRERIEVREVSDAGGLLDLDWVQEHERATLDTAGAGWQFTEQSNAPVLRRLAELIVEVESPVHQDYVVKRMADAFGIRRRGSNVVAAAMRAIEGLVGAGAIDRRGDFLWSGDGHLTVVRISSNGDPTRAIGEIPPEEIDLAILKLREAGGDIDDDELVKQVARLFGFKATGKMIRTAIEARF